MLWLLEQDVFPDGLCNLMDAISREGHGYKLVGSISDIIDACADHQEECLFYGSLEMSKKIQGRKSWCETPTVWCSLEQYKCSTYYPHYAPFLLNSEYAILPISEAIRQQNWLFERFAIDGKVFVRPNDGDKPFAGRVLTRE